MPWTAGILLLAVITSPASAAIKLPLRTLGSEVVDAGGNAVRLACVNWYGAHMERFVVNGLDKRPAADIAADIASLGFNCVRFVFSNDLFFKNPTVEEAAVSANPSFVGRKAMDVFDSVVQALTTSGVMVILNNHISTAGWCCSTDDGNGLWYTKEYPTDKWQSMWVSLTTRYKANPLVVAADLRNELRSANGVAPTWGSNDTTTDWRKAAMECGNAVLKENSDILIIVEGLNYANILTSNHAATDPGVCDDCLAGHHPIHLAVPNRLVYSGHAYGWDHQFPTDNYTVFAQSLEKHLTYVTTAVKPYTAPFWLGEFGENSQSSYWNFTIQFLQQNPSLGWAYWALDGYKHSGGEGDDETFGIFMQDYKTIRHPWKLADLQNVQKSDLTSVIV